MNTRTITTAPWRDGFDYTVYEFAAELRLHPMTITKAIAAGFIRSYKFGRARRIPREEVERIRREGLRTMPAKNAGCDP